MIEGFIVGFFGGGGAKLIPTLTIQHVTTSDGLNAIRIPEVDADLNLNALVAFGGNALIDEYGGLILANAYVYSRGEPLVIADPGTITALGVRKGSNATIGNGLVTLTAPAYNEGSSQLMPVAESDDENEPLARYALTVPVLPGIKLAAIWYENSWGATYLGDIYWPCDHPNNPDGTLNTGVGWFDVPVVNGVGIVPVPPSRAGGSFWVVARKDGCNPSSLVAFSAAVNYPTISFSDGGDPNSDGTRLVGVNVSNQAYAVAAWEWHGSYNAPSLPLTPGNSTISLEYTGSNAGNGVSACVVLRRGQNVVALSTVSKNINSSDAPTINFSTDSTPANGTGAATLSGEGSSFVYKKNGGTETAYTGPISVSVGDAIVARALDGIVAGSWSDSATFVPQINNFSVTNSNPILVNGQSQFDLHVAGLAGCNFEWSADSGSTWNAINGTDVGGSSVASFVVTDNAPYSVRATRSGFTPSSSITCTAQEQLPDIAFDPAPEAITETTSVRVSIPFIRDSLCMFTPDSNGAIPLSNDGTNSYFDIDVAPGTTLNVTAQAQGGGEMQGWAQSTASAEYPQG